MSKYKIYVDEKLITSSNNYDKILDKFVKVVKKEEEAANLKKGECIKITIKDDKRIYLKNEIRE